ncbi:MAG: phenylalanine--tRNA ligase subunit beta [Rhodospirillaceae bacterium]|nr:phenylalanine--tRNA ligase subunit beta [Rhodospirillaceae bacterium]MBL6941237.1 phenylalanine--tRNA ligase subunit beta [Rhodospirillales bacterium]
MKITFGWLKEHLETDASLIEITDKLTMLGLEIESVSERAQGLENFVVGHVVEATKHPDADKLQVCRVDNGSEIFDVVCGAPNARTGLKGIFAASGSYIPGIDVTLKAASIRGVESNGMLLSEREMGLSDEHDGIVELADDAPIGALAVSIMGLDDPVIDIAITPNRGDCLGIRGIARDLAAAGLGTLKALDETPINGTFESPIKVTIDLEPAYGDACPQFVGRYIRGVKNVESPKWLKDRLLAIGLRPITALVDITNLMTIEHCRPLHVFDADKVSGNIHARMARDGETLLALDGKEYALDSEITVIADDNQAEAMGGVMGGEASGCTEDTVNVFVESALFDPIRTSSTGRRLNLQSDARFRFERGIDSAFLVPGMEIATRLILDICGGEPSELVIAGTEPDRSLSIPLRPARVKELAGVEVDVAEMQRILGVLGFSVTHVGEPWTVSVPTWRNDIVGEACLVEEIVRVHGYDKIPTTPMQRDEVVPHPAWTLDQRRRADIRRTLASRGLVEAVTLSFMDFEQARLFGGGADDLKLLNPISSDLGIMRPSILPNLIAAAGRNADRGIADCPLFEVGPQFSGDEADGQAIVAAGLRAGRRGRRNWAEAPRAVDAFDAKADALAALAVAGAPTAKLQTLLQAPGWYHPGRSGTLNLGPQTVLAAFGEIHPGILAKMGVKGPVVGFEVYLDNVPKTKGKKAKGTTRPLLKLSPFHPVSRDFAFVVDEDIAADAVIRAAKSADKELITDVSVFDLFAGGNLGEGRKSLAVNVTLQPTRQTLTDGEIEAVSKKLVAAVEKSTGGVLRT